MPSPFSGEAMALYPHTLPAANEDFDGITAQIVSNTDHFNNDSTTDWNFTQGTDAQIAVAGNANGGTFTNGLSNDGASDRIIFLNYNGLTSNHTVFGFEQSDGDHFGLTSFELGNNLAGYSLDVTITVLYNGSEVGSATINLNTSSASDGITYTYGGDSSSGSARPYGTVTFDATQYRNVDEVRLVYTGAATPIMDNIVVSAPVINVVPVVNTIPADITVTEDTTSNFSLTTLDLTDDNDDELTVTLTIDTGTFTSVADGAASGVTETLVSATEITLVGNADEIEAYLSDASVIQYLGANNDSGDNAGQLTVNIDDGFDTVGATSNIDITNVNDPATFGGTLSANIDEDSDTVGGTATVSDIDNADTFSADTVSGTYGDLTIAANGDWVYDLDEANTDVQGLSSGDTLGDTLTVSATDGTTQTITITIDGADDAPVFGGDLTASVSAADTVNATGTATVSDADTGEDHFGDAINGMSVTGTYGSFTIAANGDWVYDLDEANTDVQALGAGDTLGDTLTVTSGDGTSQNIVITINGYSDNSAPYDVALSTSGVTENQSGVLVGTLSATDPDGDQLTYSVNDNRFRIEGDKLYLSTGAYFDYEQGSSVSVRIYAHDPGGLTGSAFVDIPVIDILNEDGRTVVGSSGDDTLRGTDGGDTINGGAGNDLLNGGAGDDHISKDDDDTGQDILIGGDGNDVLSGGGGNDFVVGDGATDGTTRQSLDENGNTDDMGADTIRGGSGDDTLLGGGWNDDLVDDDGWYTDGEEVEGDTDQNRIWAGSGEDVAVGSSGSDVIGGSSGHDTLKGLSGDDTLFGNDDNDSLLGGSGDDLLYGGNGDDTVDGGAGDDSLWAGAGDDLFSGGEGADTFLFGAAAGNDTITDFNLDDDSLDLAARGFADLAAVEAASSDTTVDGESGLLIDLGDGESVFLMGLSVSDLGSMQITV